jgi:hypothetical protein
MNANHWRCRHTKHRYTCIHRHILSVCASRQEATWSGARYNQTLQLTDLNFDVTEYVDVSVNVNVEGVENKRQMKEGFIITHHKYGPQYGRYVPCPRMMGEWLPECWLCSWYIAWTCSTQYTVSDEMMISYQCCYGYHNTEHGSTVYCFLVKTYYFK